MQPERNDLWIADMTAIAPRFVTGVLNDLALRPTVAPPPEKRRAGLGAGGDPMHREDIQVQPDPAGCIRSVALRGPPRVVRVETTSV
jgi:hypothetical protein